jgi:hypothetical protein
MNAKNLLFLNRLTLPATLLLAAGLAVDVQGQGFVSGSDGSYGPLEITTNTTLAMPADGVFHCTTISIHNGATLRFIPNGRNTPVRLLATGDVLISGTIDVSGSDGTALRGGAGGPGGFAGGNPGRLDLPPASAPARAVDRPTCARPSRSGPPRCPHLDAAPSDLVDRCACVVADRSPKSPASAGAGESAPINASFCDTSLRLTSTFWSSGTITTNLDHPRPLAEDPGVRAPIRTSTPSTPGTDGHDENSAKLRRPLRHRHLPLERPPAAGLAGFEGPSRRRSRKSPGTEGTGVRRTATRLLAGSSPGSGSTGRPPLTPATMPGISGWSPVPSGVSASPRPPELTGN